MNSMLFRRFTSKKSMHRFFTTKQNFTTKENTMEDLQMKIVRLENDLKNSESKFAFFAFANLTIGTISLISIYGTGSN
jgi:hypothetical protein